MPRSLSRHRFLEILRAALTAQQYRFARQAALDWLSTYPGDLVASLYYGRALLGENRLTQAMAIFQGVRRVDPEYVEAVEALVEADARAGGMAGASARAQFMALTGNRNDRQTMASWGGKLWLARNALERGNLALAGEMIDESLREADNIPLAGVLHLRHLAESGQADAKTRREIALGYHQRWPDCVACMLWLSHWSMEIGETDYAVALLHQAVSRDTGGQVVRRLWGAQHPYRALWPEQLELSLILPIPADVTALLGWNRLSPGEVEQDTPPADAETASEPLCADLSEARQDQPGEPLSEVEETLTLLQVAGLEWALAESDGEGLCALAPEVSTVAAPVESKNHKPPTSPPAPDPEVGNVRQEFDRLARRLKLPAVGRQDGRFPVYVVFSVRSRLEAVYGSRIADLLVSEMLGLAEAVGSCKGWSARVFLPDDTALVTPLGLTPLKTIDPWELKLALVDLDAVLERRGERIGAVLIVGGPEIVPFHCLPNPIDDQDDDVPTDNPYATRDENYFVPEWPVGRLPGGKGNDARLILATLSRIRAAHEANRMKPSWWTRLVAWLRRPGSPARATTSGIAVGAGDRMRSAKQGHALGRQRKAFGYTAAIWKQAAWQVFRPIGKPVWMSVSPPFGFDGAEGAPSLEAAGAVGKIPAMHGRLAYFNLHGLVDAPEWYGQRDPLDGRSDPDYPVALRPKDILCNSKATSEEIPAVVFSEACYGLHIENRATEEAISLSLLQAGAMAVVGSTCMAYGSIGAPLVAADLLGHTFWRYLQEGFTAGEALGQAKIHLASVMSERQGYLDGEDQKTLISFILYGDPLAQSAAPGRTAKSLRYRTSPVTEIHTVCERESAVDMAAPLPVEVVASVKRVVAHHLPGMSDARLTLVHPRATCSGEGHDCPTSQLDHSGCLPDPQPALQVKSSYLGRGNRRGLWNKSKAEATRSLVTLSKQVALPNGTHPRVARLTLDERGKLVKLVVSR